MSPVSASARAEWSRRLGRALVNEGYLSEHSISPLLEEAASTGAPLGVILIRRGAVASPVVVRMLAQLARLPVVDLQTDPPSPDAVNLVPSLVAIDHQALAVRVVGNQAVVVFAEPPDAADVRSIGGWWASRSSPCSPTPSPSPNSSGRTGPAARTVDRRQRPRLRRGEWR